jgi:hypothetical protein
MSLYEWGGLEMRKIVVISVVFVIISILTLVTTVISLETSSTIIRGEYDCRPNPCFTEDCIPGMMWAVKSDDTIYYLKGNCGWVWGCEIVPWTFGYRPKEGATVVVIGKVSEGLDVVWNRPFYYIEVEYLLPGRCPVEIIYGTDSAETELLRSIRDNVLSKTPEGLTLIELYYQWSPVIVSEMERDEDFKQEVKDMLDEFLGIIGEGS